MELVAQPLFLLLGADRYGHVAKLLSTLEPYVVLWTTVNTFYSKYATWMNGAFTKLNPEEVEGEAADAFR